MGISPAAISRIAQSKSFHSCKRITRVCYFPASHCTNFMRGIRSSALQQMIWAFNPPYKCLLTFQERPVRSVSLNILTKTGTRNATAPNLYGWMFEDINHSGDGGLYGELLTNRAFDGSDIAWGTVPNFLGSSIVYQENPCEAFGKASTSGETTAC